MSCAIRSRSIRKRSATSPSTCCARPASGSGCIRGARTRTHPTVESKQSCSSRNAAARSFGRASSSTRAATATSWSRPAPRSSRSRSRRICGSGWAASTSAAVDEIGFRTTAPGRVLVPWGPLDRQRRPDRPRRPHRGRARVPGRGARRGRTRPRAPSRRVARRRREDDRHHREPAARRRLRAREVRRRSAVRRRDRAHRPLDPARSRVRRALPLVDDRGGAQPARQRTMHLREPLRAPGDQGDTGRDGDRRSGRSAARPRSPPTATCTASTSTRCAATSRPAARSSSAGPAGTGTRRAPFARAPGRRPR